MKSISNDFYTEIFTLLGKILHGIVHIWSCLWDYEFSFAIKKYHTKILCSSIMKTVKIIGISPWVTSYSMLKWFRKLEEANMKIRKKFQDRNKKYVFQKKAKTFYTIRTFFFFSNWKLFFFQYCSFFVVHNKKFQKTFYKLHSLACVFFIFLTLFLTFCS